MQRVIILTEDEYDQLKSESPSSILQATVGNLKKSNDHLTKQVSELQQELSTYRLVSATKEPSTLARGYTFRDYVREYNFIVECKKTKAFKSTITELASFLFTTPDIIKSELKRATDNGTIYRDTKSNKYKFN